MCNGETRRPACATLPLGGLMAMAVPTRGWYTVQEAAAEIGVTDSYVRRLIREGTLAAEPIGARGYQVWPAGVESYKRTRQGGQGWDKRKAEEYAPSKAAQWARTYRARKKSERDAPTITVAADVSAPATGATG